MAIDLSLLGNFGFLFSFFIVLVLTHVVLGITNLFKDQKHLQTLLSFSIAFIILFATPALKLITFMTQWFAVFFVFVMFILIAIMMFGIKSEDITKYIKTPSDGSSSSVIIAIVVIASLILLSGIGLLFFSGDSSQTSQDLQQTANSSSTASPGSSAVQSVDSARGPQVLEATIFHPKVLGMIFILLFGMFTVQQLSK
jgi:hypothetical protein